MRSVFLDYDTVSFNDDLSPATLAGIAPNLSLRHHTAQESVAASIEGAAIVLVNKLRLDRAAHGADAHAQADRIGSHWNE